jgi:hypothetical protein
MKSKPTLTFFVNRKLLKMVTDKNEILTLFVNVSNIPFPPHLSPPLFLYPHGMFPI